MRESKREEEGKKAFNDSRSLTVSPVMIAEARIRAYDMEIFVQPFKPKMLFGFFLSLSSRFLGES